MMDNVHIEPIKYKVVFDKRLIKTCSAYSPSLLKVLWP